MTRRFYLRPLPLTAFDQDTRGCDGAAAFRFVAGRSDIGFSHMELIERRNDKSKFERRLLPAIDDFASLGSSRTELEGLFGRIVAPRAPFAGLAMNRPQIMGIINVTPDSFSDGGAFDGAEAAIAHGLRLVKDGADILDIGGESTRPGSDAVPLQMELDRVMPVIEGLAARADTVLSIDTRKAAVMRQAASAGARIINDVSAMAYDTDAIASAAELGLPVILMHALGDPKTMQVAPRYDDVLLDVFGTLEARIAACVAGGIDMAKIAADPGIGFGKTLAHNLALMGGFALLHGLGVPLMLGASRKSFIKTLLGVENAPDRVPGSLAAALAAAQQGAQFLRVHDVAATVQAVRVFAAIAGSAAPPPAG